MPPNATGSGDGPDEPSPSDGGSTSTRRRVLKALGGVGLAGVLGTAGWIGRWQYLTGERDRTDLGSAVRTRSQRTGPTAQAVPADELLEQLTRFSTQRSEVGLQATVIFDDGTRWHGVAGAADHGGEDPLTHEFHLYIGSVTKLFTATLVLRQVQRGAISLTDTIDAWFDLDYASDVTVRMLLNHTSGVPNYTSDTWFLVRYLGQPTRRWTPADLLDVISGPDLAFEPGSRHEYSNSNYVLLGILLERVTGRRYGTLLRDLVRSELGLDHTYYLDYPATVPIANAYDESVFGLGRRNLTGLRTSLETGAYAAGGILSTAPDVAGVVHALFSGEVLDAETLAAMRTFVDAPDEDVTTQVGYGLGLRHLRVGGEDLYGHTGTIPGYSAVAMHHDQPRYTIAVLSNVSTIDQAGICETLQRIVLDDYY